MATQQADGNSHREDATIPLFEEVATLSKQEHVTGRIRVSTRVETVDQNVKAALTSEAVEVTRVAVDRMVDEAPPVRTENGVTIIPILEEVLVVEKRLLLKEELHIRRVSTTETVEQPVSLRRQHAVVERFGEDGAEPVAR